MMFKVRTIVTESADRTVLLEVQQFIRDPDYLGYQGRFRYLYHPLRMLDLLLLIGCSYLVGSMTGRVGLRPSFSTFWPVCLIRMFNIIRLISFDRSLASFNIIKAWDLKSPCYQTPLPTISVLEVDF